MATGRTSNPVRCMTDKNKARYFARLNSRRETLESVLTAYDVYKHEDMYKLTEDYFGVGGDGISHILNTIKNVKNCDTPPFYGFCKNTVLCDQCLSAWRYKVYKKICELRHSGNATLVHYQHDYIVPRGVALDPTDSHRDIFRYLLIDGFNDVDNPLYTHVPLSHQFVPRRIYRCPTRYTVDNIMTQRFYGNSDGLELEEKSYNDMHSIYDSVITGNSNPCTRHNLFDHSEMVGNIMSYMTAERTMLTNYICGASEFAGVAYRRSMRLVDEDNLLCFTFSAVMPTYVKNYTYLGERTRFLLEGGEGAQHDYGSDTVINEYKVPFNDNSDMYVSNRVSVKSIKSTSKDLKKFLDRAFPYNATIDNMTPLELLLCYCALTWYDSTTSLSGLLRD